MRKTLKKIVTATVLAVSVFSTASVSAEQPKADEYRRILNSGKFYIEYGHVTDIEYNNTKMAKRWSKYDSLSNNANKSALAITKSKKILLTKGSRFGDNMAMLKYMSSKNKFFKDVTQYMNSKELRKNILYRDNKYYQFWGKNNAFMANEKNLNDDTGNIYENWQQAVQLLSLPRFLEALSPDSDYETADTSYEPVYIKKISAYVESGKENILGQDMYFDKYEVKYDANNGYKWIYYLYYDIDGNLEYIKEDQDSLANEQIKALQEMVKKSPNSIGTVKNTYWQIYTITDTIPAGIFDMPKGCKVYSMDTGSLDDLLGEPTLVEQY